MKNKLTAVLLAVLTISILAVCSFSSVLAAEDNVIFVANEAKGLGDGSTPENAMGHGKVTVTIGDKAFTDASYSEVIAYLNSSAVAMNQNYTLTNLVKANVLYRAFEALKDKKGTVVITEEIALSCSDRTQNSSAAEFGMPASSGTVTVTSSYGGVDYRNSGAKLVLDHSKFNAAHLDLRTATVWKNLNIEYKYHTKYTQGSWEEGYSFYAGGKNLTVDEGVAVTSVDVTANKAGDRYPNIFAGRRYATSTGDPVITVKSGTWNGVFGAGHSMSSTSSQQGQLSGSTTINIMGGKINTVNGSGSSLKNRTYATVTGNVLINVLGNSDVGTITAATSAGVKGDVLISVQAPAVVSEVKATSGNGTVGGTKKLTYEAGTVKTVTGFENDEIVGPDGEVRVEFTYTVKDGKATVTGSKQNVVGILEIPEILGGYPVTAIGNNAFSDHIGLTGVIIPSGVVSIGGYAFIGCSSLASVEISKDNKNFVSDGKAVFNKDMTELVRYLVTTEKEYVIPNSVKVIASSAFGGSWSVPGHEELTSVKLPDGLTTIGDNAFCGCKGLTEIVFPNSVESIGYMAFKGCIGLKKVDYPLNATVEDYAFGQCSGLEELNIPEGVVYIAYQQFSGCTSLKTLDLPETLHTIETGAFSECTSLESIKFPKNLKNILGNSFSGCDSLTSVELPANMDFCHSDVFMGCENLEHISYPDSVTILSQNWFITPTNLKSVELPPSIKEMGYGFFDDAQKLEKVYIKDLAAYCGIKITDFYTAFSGNPSTMIISPFSFGADLYLNGELVTELVIPEGVTSISDFAFYNCGSIKSIKLPDSLETIGAYAFYGTPFYNDESNWENGALYIDGHLIAVKDEIKGEYNVKAGTKSIAGGAFANQAGMTGVKIPDGLLSLGLEAFYGCTSLTKVDIPHSVKNISDKAFYGCTALSEVSFPENLKYLGTMAFNGCTLIKEIEFTASNAVIREDAFPASGLINITDMKDWLNNDFVGYNYGSEQNLYLNGQLITELVIPEGVKYIPDYAFYGNKNITSVKLPSSLVGIGGGAFSGCSNIQEVHISNLASYCEMDCGYYAVFGSEVVYYVNGTPITDLVVPEGVKKIGDGLFYGSTTIKSVVIPDGVTHIGERAFYNCGFLNEVRFPDSLTYIGTDAFGNTGLLGDDSRYDENGVLYIGNNLIKVDKDKMSGEYTVKEGTVSIAQGAFNGVTDLTKVVFPDSLKTIGSQAFEGCTGLTELIIPNGVERIDYRAFYGCTNVDKISLPDSLYFIGANVFENTAYYNDESNWENDVLYIGKHLIRSNGRFINGYEVKEGTLTIAGAAFSNVYVGTYYNIGGKITIPDSVVSICDAAFKRCLMITEFKLSANLKYIGECAFCRCFGLECIEIPDSVEFIDDMAFYGCTKLTEVKLPANLEIISEGLFQGCENLEKIEIPATVKTVKNGVLRKGYLSSRSGVVDNFKDIYFLGSEEEWNDIVMGSDNKVLLEANIHFNSSMAVKGDVDGNEGVDSDDAVYLLYHVLFGEEAYPLLQKADFNKDGIVDSDDAVYLLYHVLFGEESYPLA